MGWGCILAAIACWSWNEKNFLPVVSMIHVFHIAVWLRAHVHLLIYILFVMDCD
jgi:hypothetical protein